MLKKNYIFLKHFKTFITFHSGHLALLSHSFPFCRKPLWWTQYLPNSPNSMGMGEWMNEMHDWKSWQQRHKNMQEGCSKRTNPKFPYFCSKNYVLHFLYVLKCARESLLPLLWWIIINIYVIVIYVCLGDRILEWS